jgi:hypothetical protein
MASEQPSPETRAESRLIQMGVPFSPFERDNLPDLSTKHFVFESSFRLEQVGAGYIQLVDMASALEHADPGVNDLSTILHTYDAPFGVLHLVAHTAPELPEHDRYTIFPVEISELRLKLDQPKAQADAPVVVLEFAHMPYRYWGVDGLGDPFSRREYNPTIAAYWNWYAEQVEKPRLIALDRNSDQLASIRLTFLPRNKLPISFANPPTAL